MYLKKLVGYLWKLGLCCRHIYHSAIRQQWFYSQLFFQSANIFLLKCLKQFHNNLWESNVRINRHCYLAIWEICKQVLNLSSETDFETEDYKAVEGKFFLAGTGGGTLGR